MSLYRRTPFRLARLLPAAVPGLASVGLMLVWAIHNGGYDDDTWYWGALGELGLLAATLVLVHRSRIRLSRLALAAIGCLALYVAWSYLSMTWAQAPGLALNGSNRALLYLIVFTLFCLLPWTAEAALLALVTFAVGVGAIAVVLLVRLASVDHLGALIIQGRLIAPIGYLNGTAALFTIQALVSIGLSARRELPGLLRGLLVALAGAALQLAVVVQSRGWLFTLPLIVLIGVIVARDRLRIAAAAAIAVTVAIIPIHRLLAIYDSANGSGLGRAAAAAGREAIVLLFIAFVGGTILAWFDALGRGPVLDRRGRRFVGGVIVGVTLAGGTVGAVAVAHGDPLTFISRQWNGFSHVQTSSTDSHFADVGSGRYDFWRVALDAFLAHPVGGLGQDNFRDYYLPRRRTGEEPAWTHSLELRLLAHTGAVGFLLFAGFLVCALLAVGRGRRRGPAIADATAGVALLPLIVWLIHGSLDWFWELPALSGPALGFLGMSVALAQLPASGPVAQAQPARHSCAALRPLIVPALVTFLVAATIVLALPYLAVRELSTASNLGPTRPQTALADLAVAAKLNPLNVDPERLAGAIALRLGEDQVAATDFRAAITREPGDWFSWLGAGLAASGLHRQQVAEHDFRVAVSINNRQPAAVDGLRRALGQKPLTPRQAFGMLVVTQ